MGKAAVLYQQSPPLAKNIMVGGAALLVVGGLFVIYRNARKNQDQKEANRAGAQAAIDLENLRKQGIVPTHYPTEIENFASSLVQSMNGCGTDEQTIYDVFAQMGNDADVLALIKVFGLRFYQPCEASSPFSYLLWLWDDESFGGDLPTWLSYDLKSGEIANINNILASNGVTIQF